METPRSVWRSLRPVLLAAAAATTWMAFSAPAATASSDTLLTNATSSVTALATAATDPSADITLPAAGDTPRSAGESPIAEVISSLSVPAPSPVAHEVTRAADGLLQGVPVVTVLVPAESLTQLTDPVVKIADTVIGDTTYSLLGQSGVVPEILDPTLKQVVDLVVAPGISAVPGTGLELPVGVDGGGKVSSLVPANADPPGGENEPLSALDTSIFGADVTRAMVSALPRGVFSSSARWGELQPRAFADVVLPAYPDGAPLNTLPDVMPALPGSGSAGGNGPGAGPSTPAWLAAPGFEVPRTTELPILGALLRSPSPVSFDPGSSPD